MPSLRQVLEQHRAPATFRKSGLPSDVPFEAPFERVQRLIDPNWRRAASQFEEPIELLKAHLGIGWKPGIHFEVMNEHFVALEQRKITALMVVTPPQHGKSTFGSVVMPAWYYGLNPTHDLIVTAYNSQHAGRFGGYARDLVNAQSKELAIDLDPLNRSRTSWGLVQGGHMHTAGLDAGITGNPCNFLIGDDPIKKPSEAFSPAYKKKILYNWLQGCETRLQPDGIRMLIMTRWAYDDLAGYLFENQPKDWTVLHMEAINTRKDDPCGREIGEALWSHYPLEVLQQRRKRVGNYVWMTMYQGKPSKRPPDHDPMISFEALGEAAQRRNDLMPDRKRGGPHVKLNPFWNQQPLDIACDVARSGRGDRLTFIGIKGNRMTLCDVKKGQRTTATANEIIGMIREHAPRSFRIDDTGVGGGVTDRVIEIIETADEIEGITLDEKNRLRSCEIVAFQFGGRAFDSSQFSDIRTEMWWYLNELLRDNLLDLPEDSELFEDLTAPMMGKHPSGRSKLESKDQMAKRGVKSPDLGDALAMAAYPWDWLITV